MISYNKYRTLYSFNSLTERGVLPVCLLCTSHMEILKSNAKRGEGCLIPRSQQCKDNNEIFKNKSIQGKGVSLIFKKQTCTPASEINYKILIKSKGKLF